MPSEVQSWSVHGEVKYLESNGGVLLIRTDRDLTRLYHAVRDEEGLARALAALDGQVHETLITELVGRGHETEAAVDVYHNYEFRDYTTLLRMTKAIEGAAPPEIATSELYAQAQDVIGIVKFLERVLDPLRDHMPLLAEIETATMSQRILVEKERQEIRGILFYENAAATSVRYWYVDPERHSDGIGGRLMREYLRLCQGQKRILLWVVSDNHHAIQKYRHYGFQFDGLSDRIMVRSGRA